MKNRHKASGSNLKISELAQHLRREHLYVTTERQLLQKLNAKVLRSAEKLHHLNWTVRQHRQLVDQAFLNQSCESDAGEICQTASGVEMTRFIDSYKRLQSKDSLYSNLLSSLRLNTKLVAQLLAAKVPGVRDAGINSLVVSSLYGDCLMPEDRVLVLHVITELISSQVVVADQPRRLLRNGSFAFCQVLKMFQETLPAAKLFLVSALREPVISVLAEDDLYLDVDAERAVFRFPVEERNRHFGKEGTPEYRDKIEMYKLWATEKLESLVSKFVDGIRKSHFCFPEQLRHVIRECHRLLIENKHFSCPEIGAICCDLAFNQFICHAVMYPELYGIVDMHITPIARFNLMQVAQVVQMLAMSKYEKTDPRFVEVCSRFESPNKCLSDFVDLLIDSETSSCHSPPDILPFHVKDLRRTSILMTEAQLYRLTNFLHDIMVSIEDTGIKNVLESLLRNLPPVILPDSTEADNQLSGDDKKGLLNMVRRSRTSESQGNDNRETHPREVLVIPIDNLADNVLPGMMSEEKVLEQELKKRQVRVRMSVDGNMLNNEETDSVVSGSALSEKRTRFSQDQESIGTSDNLEAISEGASTHSAEPSIESESENENDNLSDMVSANVSSGRGTPNVSGRDTPSTDSFTGHDQTDQPDAVTEETAAVAPQSLAAVRAPDTTSRTPDIEEKFGKFDCKPSVPGVAVDETKSMLSDTWSTDVLGSESEALVHRDPTLLRPAPTSVPTIAPVTPASVAAASFSTGPEELETASQSDAWSTDVLTSDTERLRDFDLEDPAALLLAEGVLDVNESDAAQETDNFGEEEVVLRYPSTSRTASSDSDPTQMDSLTMQTLGRISFDLRQKQNDEEAVELFCSLKTANESQATGQRTSISELLSLEFPEETSAQSPIKPQSDEPFSLIDFEKEMAAADGDPVDNLIDLSSSNPRESSSEQKGNTDSGISFSATSFNEVTHSTPNGEVPVETSGKPSAATGAIPKTVISPKPKSSTYGVGKSLRPTSQPDAATDRRKGGFFKLSSNLKKNLQEKMKSLSKRGSTSSFNSEVFMSGKDESVTWGPKETSDDILNKYKQKDSESAEATGAGNESLLVDFQKASESSDNSAETKACSIESAKRKLRRVLSLVDIHGLPISCIQSGSLSNPDPHSELIKFLRLLLAEAKHLSNSVQVVAIQETIRCVESLDDKSCQQIFWSLREDYERRVSFISYLLKSKQSLLSIEAHLESLTDHMSQEKTTCLHNLIYICVKQYLERKEKVVAHFMRCFQRLTAPDEKVQVVERFLNFMYRSMEKDAVWRHASDELIEFAKEVIDRCVMSQIYMFALYPNGDGDVLRDQILHQHISRLSRNLSLNHKDLRIPSIYHSEAPWLSAQEEISTINAFKTPKEKVRCVVRTCTIIMSLLSLASDRSVPAADDLMPVLVYVILKANPPSLLSTVQYVTSFYENHFEGEEAYWWTQFSSVIEFIKTMD